MSQKFDKFDLSVYFIPESSKIQITLYNRDISYNWLTGEVPSYIGEKLTKLTHLFAGIYRYTLQLYPTFVTFKLGI